MASPSDEERFRALYERHHPAIIAYLVRRIGRSQDAADAADDVFAVAWRRFSKVPEEDETLRWPSGVAHNVLANRRRGERRGNRLLARLGSQRQPDLLGPEPQVLRNLEGQHVMEVLGSMRPDDQELVLSRIGTRSALRSESRAPPREARQIRGSGGTRFRTLNRLPS
ncbi:MAG: hypothetical protein OEP52_05770 [Acidimicrobiia bacterium]|nr:hypothetical protein [Acidimicrobiia bacterium]